MLHIVPIRLPLRTWVVNHPLMTTERFKIDVIKFERTQVPFFRRFHDRRRSLISLSGILRSNNETATKTTKTEQL